MDIRSGRSPEAIIRPNFVAASVGGCSMFRVSPKFSSIYFVAGDSSVDQFAVAGPQPVTSENQYNSLVSPAEAVSVADAASVPALSAAALSPAAVVPEVALPPDEPQAASPNTIAPVRASAHAFCTIRLFITPYLFSHFVRLRFLCVIL